MVASFTLPLDARNMIHDGRGFALGKPRFNWCVGVELLGAGETPCWPIIINHAQNMLFRNASERIPR